MGLDVSSFFLVIFSTSPLVGNPDSHTLSQLSRSSFAGCQVAPGSRLGLHRSMSAGNRLFTCVFFDSASESRPSVNCGRYLELVEQSSRDYNPSSSEGAVTCNRDQTLGSFSYSRRARRLPRYGPSGHANARTDTPMITHCSTT